MYFWSRYIHYNTGPLDALCSLIAVTKYFGAFSEKRAEKSKVDMMVSKHSGFLVSMEIEAEPSFWFCQIWLFPLLDRTCEPKVWCSIGGWIVLLSQCDLHDLPPPPPVQQTCPTHPLTDLSLTGSSTVPPIFPQCDPASDPCWPPIHTKRIGSQKWVSRCERQSKWAVSSCIDTSSSPCHCDCKWGSTPFVCRISQKQTCGLGVIQPLPA